jgi:predicted PurR-regulated permease PerM
LPDANLDTVGGVLGLIMAIPVLALVMIIVDELYVKKINVE